MYQNKQKIAPEPKKARFLAAFLPRALASLYSLNIRIMAKPGMLGAISGICIAVALLAPFQSDEFTALDRVLYSSWWIISILFFHLTLKPLFHFLLARRDIPLIFGNATASALAMIPPPVIWYFAFGFPPASISDFVQFIVGTLVIAAFVTIPIAIPTLPLVVMRLEADGIIAHAYKRPPKALGALNGRLPKHKRGLVLVLEVQGKYIEVTTTRARHLLRGSLKEFEDMLEQDAGLRVHRSVWIRFDQIKSMHYSNGNPFIDTYLGREFPISRSVVPRVRAYLSRS